MKSNEQETKKVPAPRLRFKQFEGLGDWEEKVMSSLFAYLPNNSLSREKLNYLSGVVKNIHYGDIHTSFATHFYLDKERVPFVNPQEDVSRFPILRAGDLVLADASEDMEDIGKAIEIIDVGSSKVIAGLHTITARPKQDKFSVGFLGHLFKSLYVKRQIQRESQGAKVLGLSPTRLSGISLPLPPTLPEQTRIAACLSSLDAVIAAHTDKLDALRQHKRGLMQQLFPAEGERVPRLRFPEFAEAGEWEEKKLGELFTHRQERGSATLPLLSLMDEKGIIPQEDTGRKDNSSADKSKYLRVYIDDIVYNTMRMWEGRSAISRLNGLVSPAYTICIPNKNISSEFFSFYFKLDSIVSEFKKYSQGIVKDTLNLKFESLSKISILIPPTLPEQTRIAACLSSLDDLISAQADKVAGLREFKRGLMQGLFPSTTNHEATE